jgi:hypothetical protein
MEGGGGGLVVGVTREESKHCKLSIVSWGGIEERRTAKGTRLD